VAGNEYGDGDEVKHVKIRGGGSETLVFDAEVYGVMRSMDTARIYVYDEEGEELARVDKDFEIYPEFASIATVLLPTWVKLGGSFSIVVPVTYSFAYPTVVKVELKSDTLDLYEVKESELEGSGLEFFEFFIGEEYSSIRGQHEFDIRMSILYPEKGYEEASLPYANSTFYTDSFKIVFSEVTANKPVSNLYPTGIRFYVEIGGEKYVAMIIYNSSGSPPSGAWETYSVRNWLVFDEEGNIVMDDEEYVKVVLAAEIAYKRMTVWGDDYLDSLSRMYSELVVASSAAESLLIVEKILLLYLNPLKGKLLESAVSRGIEGAVQAVKIVLTEEQILEILKSIKFADSIITAASKAEKDAERAIAFACMINLLESANRLQETKKYLRDLDIGSVIEFEDAMAFLESIKFVSIAGKSAIKLLLSRYSDVWLPLKEAFVELIPLGNAIDVYEKLSKMLKEEGPILDYFRFIFNEAQFFHDWERALIENALKFRNAYLSSIANSIVVKLEEPLSQEKLYLHVYDAEGRHIGLNRDIELVEVEIPGAYYFDLGRMMLVILPSDITTAKIKVDAKLAEEELESYSLSVSILREGKEVRKEVVEGSVKKEESVSYELKVSEGEVEIRPIKAFPHLSLLIVISVVAVVIIVLLLIALRRKRTLEVSSPPSVRRS